MRGAEVRNRLAETTVPDEVVYLVERIMAHLPSEVASGWFGRVVDSLRVGDDVTTVWLRFAIWLLTDECPSDVGSIAVVGCHIVW